MRIGILGAGGMAGALGTQFVRAGHEVMVGGRNLERARAAAAAIHPTAAGSGSLAEAASFGEVVVLAVPAGAVPAVLEASGAGAGALRDRVVLDVTNPIVPGPFTLSTPPGESMAERVAVLAVGAPVVKGFNLCHVSVWRMTPPAFDDQPLVVPLCGDDPEALATVSGLVDGIGCVAVEGGGLARAGLLEATAAFMIGVWAGGGDARSAFPPLAFAFGHPS